MQDTAYDLQHPHIYIPKEWKEPLFELKKGPARFLLKDGIQQVWKWETCQPPQRFPREDSLEEVTHDYPLTGDQLSVRKSLLFCSALGYAVLTKTTPICFMILNVIRELTKKLFPPLTSILERDLHNCKPELCLKIRRPLLRRPVWQHSHSRATQHSCHLRIRSC